MHQLASAGRMRCSPRTRCRCRCNDESAFRLRRACPVLISTAARPAEAQSRRRLSLLCSRSITGYVRLHFHVERGSRVTILLPNSHTHTL